MAAILPPADSVRPKLKTIAMNAINDSAPPSRKLDRWPVWLISTAAGALAAKLGWDFGVELSGALLGVMAAANFGVMSALLVGTGVEKLWLLLKGH
jgi:hypothetical protein